MIFAKNYTRMKKEDDKQQEDMAAKLEVAVKSLEHRGVRDPGAMFIIKEVITELKN